jgi:hypothetical protein
MRTCVGCILGGVLSFDMNDGNGCRALLKVFPSAKQGRGTSITVVIMDMEQDHRR